jgi:hypothetical protein
MMNFLWLADIFFARAALAFSSHLSTLSLIAPNSSLIASAGLTFGAGLVAGLWVILRSGI